MEVKVADYRVETEKAEFDALVDLIFHRYREQSGNEDDELKGDKGLQKVANWLKIIDFDDMKGKVLAGECAKMMELEQPTSKWPHVQQLGDCLRCCIECPDVQSMLQSWRRLREVFQIRKGRGRLKNNLLHLKIPPDMLVS